MVYSDDVHTAQNPWRFASGNQHHVDKFEYRLPAGDTRTTSQTGKLR